MPAVTFASKLATDGSVAVPREAVEELGLHPGDEVRVRVEAATGTHDQDSLDSALSDLLEEARRLAPQPGLSPSDLQESAFGQVLKEKYRKQGFAL